VWFGQLQSDVVKLIEKKPKAPGSTKWVIKKRLMSATVPIRWLERVHDPEDSEYSEAGWLLEWNDKDFQGTGVFEACDAASLLKGRLELIEEVDKADTIRHRITQEETERLTSAAIRREDSSEDSRSGTESDDSDSSSDGVVPEFDVDVIFRQASSNA
jgi:hypothetical protein